MIIAKREHKKDSVRIIADTFDANPSVNIVIGDKGNRQKKIRRLADYAFVKALNREGAYLSDNKMGTALCFASDKKVFSLAEIYFEVRFALSIPVKKVFQTLKRESYIKKHRIERDHLYFWFLGVQKGGGKAGFEMKDYLFDLSEKEGLPIILETSVERNKQIYERYGFEVYHVWPDSGGGKPLWFMVRLPKNQKA
jgi:hypothetical protein